MDELAREYVQTRDKKIDKRIIKELYELARELEKWKRVIGLKNPGPFARRGQAAARAAQ